MEIRCSFAEMEKEIRLKWDNQFTAPLGKSSEKKTWSIIMPPPNVTGSLHLGHALSSTLQDALARYYRMKGWDVLWLPGTDHAGIATQMMVEKDLASQGKFKNVLGREKFLEYVWSWKEKYGNTIVEQMKALGFSADWSRLTFTLDATVSEAVLKTFVDLYQRGLIYQDLRLVNWDPKLATALSDLEVDHLSQTDSIWTLSYPIVSLEKEAATETICVATTRPETLFGDVAVAVHPLDPRYQHLIGKKALVPLIHREIPIIADDSVLMDKGTGAVKITPAHDFADFSLAQRHRLPFVDVMDDQGVLNHVAPSPFCGMESFQARTAVLEALKDHVISCESIHHTVPYSQRSGAVIEPRLTKQWFIDTKGMAEKAMEAVRQGYTQFIPKEWESHFFGWLENIQPWCVSRQLWWGHRIPVWYGPEDSVFVATHEEEAYFQARQRWGKDVILRQDEDVLDTWFSSALWPFSTLGWPKETPEIEKYYPTSLLVTGFDILFFWVARMMMMGLEMTGKVPFKKVYIHPLIRDEKGQKMSKTKGNVIDPLTVIQEWGADALRFSLLSASTPSQHISFGLKQVETSRNFMTKIWNTARFIQMHCQGLTTENSSIIQENPALWSHLKGSENRWILKQIQQVCSDIAQELEAFKFHEAARHLLDFVWKIFCDWYIEIAKIVLLDPEHPLKTETLQTLRVSFLMILKMLHPFSPFITEKLWEIMGEKNLLCHASWPFKNIEPIDRTLLEDQDLQDFQYIMTLVTEIRRIRALFQLSPRTPLSLVIPVQESCWKNHLYSYQNLLEKLACIKNFLQDPPSPSGMVQIFVEGVAFGIFLGDVVQVASERQRLSALYSANKLEEEKLQHRLSDEHFLQKAPEDVVLSLRLRWKELHKKQKELEKILEAF